MSVTRNNSSASKPLSEIKGIGPKIQKSMELKGFNTVNDLLMYFPEDYIDAGKKADSLMKEVETAVISVKIENITPVRINSWKIKSVKVRCSLGSQDVYLIFFNRPYLLKSIKRGSTLTLYGKFTQKGAFYESVNPVIIQESDRSFIPVYRKIGDIGSKRTGTFIKNALKADCVQEQDEDKCIIYDNHDFFSYRESLAVIHCFNRDVREYAEISKAKQRFVFDKFLRFNIEINYMRKFFSGIKRTFKYRMSDFNSLYDSLPFELSKDQKSTFADIVSDMKAETVMQRIIIGDVGTGKTIICFMALKAAVLSGKQGVLICPTGILASQHYENALKYFKYEKTVLLTGATKRDERAEIIKRIKHRDIDILIGTHSLLNTEVDLSSAGMIVIDEQHRFGVLQRAALYRKSRGADLLVTSATPIPRTLRISMYRGLSVSVIKSRPLGRKCVKTKLLRSSSRERFYNWLREKIRGGSKAYIVVPLKDESEISPALVSLNGNRGKFESLFSKEKTGFLSSDTPDPEKEKIMGDFLNSKIRVLVTTTVIEVGMDVKDADIIVIENSERFGMAQLHQLRGRVGRGTRESFCFFIADDSAADRAKERLKFLRDHSDGFDVSEKDLLMRGEGDLSGYAQSGNATLSLREIYDNRELFESSIRDSELIVSEQEKFKKYFNDIFLDLDERVRTVNFS